MVQESERNAAEDKQKREKIDRKNQADSLCYQSEKQLEQLGDKIKPETKSNIENLIKTLKVSIQEEKDEDIKLYMEKLQTELMEIGKNVYSSESTSTQTAPKDDSVIDADFKETK
jgi:molecular chaperone DnaK